MWRLSHYIVIFFVYVVNALRWWMWQHWRVMTNKHSLVWHCFYFCATNRVRCWDQFTPQWRTMRLIVTSEVEFWSGNVNDVTLSNFFVITTLYFFLCIIHFKNFNIFTNLIQQKILINLIRWVRILILIWFNKHSHYFRW